MSKLIPIEDRFFDKVMPEPMSGCWLWIATRIPRGYGIIGKGGRKKGYVYAHRLSYEIHKGKFDQKLNVCHSCDNPCCVNPDHLFLGTQKQNLEDCRKKKRHMYGVNHVHAVINNEIARSIRSEYAAGGTSLSILGKKYGIGFQHVHNVVMNKIWRET